MGASPDGLITCDCCGTGCLEVKCPFSVREDLPNIPGVVSYLEKLPEDDKLHLKQDHTYFFQVQSQMHMCDVQFCDFVVWTSHGIHIERIKAATDFFQATVDKVSQFYKYGVLPELIGKWYSKKPINNMLIEDTNESTASTSTIDPISTNDENTNTNNTLPVVTNEQSFCYCKQPESGHMIACDYPGCSTEWFHLS